MGLCDGFVLRSAVVVGSLDDAPEMMESMLGDGVGDRSDVNFSFRLDDITLKAIKLEPESSRTKTTAIAIQRTNFCRRRPRGVLVDLIVEVSGLLSNKTSLQLVPVIVPSGMLIVQYSIKAALQVDSLTSLPIMLPSALNWVCSSTGDFRG